MISFSSITDKPKTNLDDVSDWYINNTIIKDPVRSIMTRRIIKVGDNNDLLEAEDDSTDRNDAILQFSRNVNPMVSVQYNNVGAGFGRSNTEAFLPYRIMKDGAFRPPIVDQRDLIPLSRQPRNTTSINTSAEFIDYSKTIRPSEDALKHREVLNTLRTIPMCSSKGYNLKTGMDQPYDVMYHIDDKPQRIKQAQFGGTGEFGAFSGADTGEGPNGYPGDNIGRDVIDGVTSSFPLHTPHSSHTQRPFQYYGQSYVNRYGMGDVSVEGFVPPSSLRTDASIHGTRHISTFRDEMSGMLEGSSGRVPIAKNDSAWRQHPQTQFKDPKNLQVVSNSSANVTKDNINRADRERHRNLPSYSVTTPKTFKGLHINYLNGLQEEERICTRGMIDPKRQRETYSYGNYGQGGGGGVKPMTINMSEDDSMGSGGVWSGQSSLSFGTKTIRNTRNTKN
jgi:hypothetical protein